MATDQSRAVTRRREYIEDQAKRGQAPDPEILGRLTSDMDETFREAALRRNAWTPRT